MIDFDQTRRQTVTRIALGAGFSVQPFESVAELTAWRPKSGLLLARSDGTLMLDAIASLEQSGIWLPVIGYSEMPRAIEIVEAVLDGAAGFLPWPFSAAELSEAVRIAAAVTPWGFVRANAGENFSGLTPPSSAQLVASLTRRETEILDLLLDGHSNSEVGMALGISPRTIEIHRANIMRKLKVHRASSMIRIALEARLMNGARPVVWSAGQRPVSRNAA